MCKQLSIDVKDLTPGRLLYARKRPVLAGNPDFNVKVPEPIVPGIAAAVEPTEASGPVDLNALPALVIPKMASLSRVPSLAVFERIPLLKVRGAVVLCFSTLFSSYFWTRSSARELFQWLWTVRFGKSFNLSWSAPSRSRARPRVISC